MTIAHTAGLIVAELARDHDIRRVAMDVGGGAATMVTTSAAPFAGFSVADALFWIGAATVLFRCIASGADAVTKIAGIISRVARKGE